MDAVGTTRRTASSRRLLSALLACLLLFATGVAGRPAGDGWALGYDLVLYNAIYLIGAVMCWHAAHRVLMVGTQRTVVGSARPSR